MADNSTFKLSDFIKFGIVEGDQDYTRDEAIAAVDSTATPLNKAYTSKITKLLPLDATNTDNADISAEAPAGKDNKVGGVLGFYSGANSATITNNTNNGNIISKAARQAGCKAAGICITGSTKIGVVISNNTNNGNVTGTENAVAAVSFSGNDSPIYKMSSYTVTNNVNNGKLYTLNYQTFDSAEVEHTYIVYGGKSQTPADNITDDVKDGNGDPVLEINTIV